MTHVYLLMYQNTDQRHSQILGVFASEPRNFYCEGYEPCSPEEAGFADGLVLRVAVNPETGDIRWVSQFRVEE